MTTSVSTSAATGARAEQNVRRAVRALMISYDVEAERLAELLGIARASVYNKTGGRSAFGVGEVAVLADFFNCSVEDLYKGRVNVDGPGPFSGTATGQPTVPNLRSIVRTDSSTNLLSLADTSPRRDRQAPKRPPTRSPLVTPRSTKRPPDSRPGNRPAA